MTMQAWMAEGPRWPSRTLRAAVAAIPMLLVACDGVGDGRSASPSPDAPSAPLEPPAPVENRARALVETSLRLDLAAQRGEAVVSIAASQQPGVSFDVGALEIHSVTSALGTLRFRQQDGQLDIGLPSSDGPLDIVIDYRFAAQDDFNGWMPEPGVSFLWPDFCGNLFPCRDEPAAGQRYRLTVSGVPEGNTAVYPQRIPAAAPAYMPAVALGDYRVLSLGTTRDGTEVKLWHLPGEAEHAVDGTQYLAQSMDFFEQTYGPYAFGDVVGSVSVRWGPGRFGGMEHHPFWHVASEAMGSPEIHAHEAAHGWFGNGVRMACWEDFALSEGTASYLAARALDQQGIDLWPEYECRLQRVCTDERVNTVARPSDCNAIRLRDHPLWSDVPYMKGAQFLRQVAERVGANAVDDALARFYRERFGTEARMQDLVDHLRAAFPSESLGIEALAQGWLYQRACPSVPDRVCR
ncbi:M1 family metallopeptidase [Algiphilus sp.]|uniref:M1 family metallopeptidase n=1 Tax=Algiphilus sp. TaxID=1872431 RepID=UPI003B52C650